MARPTGRCGWSWGTWRPEKTPRSRMGLKFKSRAPVFPFQKALTCCSGMGGSGPMVSPTSGGTIPPHMQGLMERPQFLLGFHNFGNKWLLGLWIMGRSASRFSAPFMEFKKITFPFWANCAMNFAKCSPNASSMPQRQPRFAATATFCDLPVIDLQESILIDFFSFAGE